MFAFAPAHLDRLIPLRNGWRPLLSGASLLAACVLATGCGGGSPSAGSTPTVPTDATGGTGSGSSSGSAGGSATSGLRLDTANMQQAARSANDSFVLFDLAIFAGQYLVWGTDWFAADAHYQCQKGDPGAGTVTLSVSRTGGAFRAGDVLTVVYNNCQQEKDDPARTTGTLRLTVESVSGDPSAQDVNQPWSYRAKAAYQGFTVLSANDRTVIDGEMTISESSPGYLNLEYDERVTTSFETAALRLTEDADTHVYTRASGTLVSNYTPEKTWVAHIGTDLDSSTLAGKISFATTEPFVGSLDSSFPSQGIGRITTASQQFMNLYAQPLGVKGELPQGQTAASFFIDWAKY